MAAVRQHDCNGPGAGANLNVLRLFGVMGFIEGQTDVNLGKPV
jgi:hypothetical protein